MTNLEYEEFETVDDLFLYLSAAAPPMKNTMPVNSYRGHVMSLVPLGPSGEIFLVIFAKGSLEPGIYEFDVNSVSHKKVGAVERADKNYFIVLSPKRNTIADAALEKL